MGGERFDPRKADKLIDPKRFKLFQPHKIIESFGVVEGETVADLGAGNGFFTIPLAEKTKTSVYAVDIEPEMLELLKLRSMEANLNNIQFVVSDLEEISLNDHSVDKAIISLVLHEVPNLTKALTEVKRILRSGGQLFIIEWEAVEMEMGPPLHERISSRDMMEILEKQGFDVELTFIKEAIYGLTATIKKGGDRIV